MNFSSRKTPTIANNRKGYENSAMEPREFIDLDGGVNSGVFATDTSQIMNGMFQKCLIFIIFTRSSQEITNKIEDFNKLNYEIFISKVHKFYSCILK